MLGSAKDAGFPHSHTLDGCWYVENFVVVDGNDYIDVGRDECATDDLVSTVTFNLQKLAGVPIWLSQRKGVHPQGRVFPRCKARHFHVDSEVQSASLRPDDAQQSCSWLPPNAPATRGALP